MLENQTRTIAKQANIYFWGRILGKIMGYLYILVLTMTLTPREFGLFRILVSFTILVSTISLLGLTGVLDRYIPVYLKNQERGKVKTLLKMVFTLSTKLGIILFLLVFFLSPYIARLFNSGVLSDEFTLGLRIISITIPILTITQLTYSIFIGHKRLFFPVWAENVIQPVIRMGAAGLIFVLGMGLLAWIQAYVLLALLVLLFAIWSSRKINLNWWNEVEYAEINNDELFSYTWPLSLSATITLITAEAVPIIIGLYRSPEEVAVYSVYFSTISIILFLENSMATIFKPIASENAGEFINKTGGLFKTVSRWGFLFAGLAIVIVITYGKELIALLFSSEYTIQPFAMIILAIGFFISNLSGPLIPLLEAEAKTKSLLYLSFGHAVLTIGLSLILVPYYGLTGAAIAFSTSYAINNVTAIIVVKTQLGIHPFSGKFINATITLLAFAAVAWISKILFGTSTPSLIAACLFLPIIFLILSNLFKAFDREDWEIIKPSKNSI